VVPRPGRTITVDFPILVNGEVNGTVYLQRGKKATELAGVTLELVGADGQVAMRTRTAYDGFYTLSLVPPGTYRLQVPGAQFTKQPLAHAYTQDVVIGPNGTLLEGLDFTLELTPHAPPKAAPPRPYGPPQHPVRKPRAGR
jgi:hypothetical protein